MKECRVNALVDHIFFIFLILNIFILFCIFCILYILNYMFTYFQHESMMDVMFTTGMLRTIAPDPVFLFGLTAGTNKPRHQIRNRTAETRINIWNRARVRRFLIHNLASGGSHNLGYHAFIWETIQHGNAGEFGKYTILKYLPDKIA